jgi:glycosyltransferase involved in cell wall biosynthesis
MKTILHTIDTTGPGGAETVFIELATRLPADKFRAVVVIRGKGWVYDELLRRGVQPILLPAKGSFNWRYLSRLAGLVRQQQVDLIQSHLLGANVYSSLAGLLTRKPVIATFHGTVDIGKNERFKGLKFGVINRGADSIVAVSNSLRADLVNTTPLKREKTRVIYNGINVADFHLPRSNVLRRQFGWAEDHIVVGSLGNIRSAKGYDVLLKAAAYLKSGQHRFRFVIAGQGVSGGLYDELLGMREGLGLVEHVHFIGFHDNPAEFLSALDLFLLPSTSEGFSLATIQAMAAGLPVVATRSGGPEEIITHGENGWLVDAGDHVAIADALERLATDHDLCGSLAAEGRKHARDTFGIGTMLAAYEEIYADSAR